jgi:hypothetical protein
MIITDALLALVDNKGDVTEHPDRNRKGTVKDK